MSQYSSPSQLSLISQLNTQEGSLINECMDDSELSPSPPQPRGWVNEHYDRVVSDGRIFRVCKAEGCMKRYSAGGSTLVYKEHWRKQHSLEMEVKRTRFMFHDHLHTNRLVKFIICCHMDYAIVEKPEFKAFVESLNPNRVLLCRQTVSQIINRGIAHLTESITMKLSNVESIALTFDVWSPNKGARGFGCVTAHFISDRGLKNIILHFKRMKFPHSAEVIRKFICKAITTFSLEGKIVAITTDNASNNISAMKMIDNSLGLSSLDLGFIHYKCVAHIIDLGMKRSMKKLKEAITPVREAVMAVRSSRKRKEKFLDKQDELIQEGKLSATQPLELAEDVDHRWNSAFVLLERAYLLRDALDFMIETTDGMTLTNEIDWSLVKTIIEFLRPFFEATKRLCSGSDVTISAVSYIVPRLIEHCAEHKSGSGDWVKEAAIAFQAKLTDYELELYHPVVDLAYVLDPRYKTKNMSEEHSERVVDRLRKYLDEMATPNESSRSTDVSIAGCDSDTDDQYDELKLYCESKRERMKTNVFEWWHVNSRTYPKLASLADKVLAVQATSVASERVFSVAGDVDTKSRNRLSDESVSAIILLKSWMQFLNLE